MFKLIRALKQQSHHVITLTGPVGCGKTHGISAAVNQLNKNNDKQIALQLLDIDAVSVAEIKDLLQHRVLGTLQTVYVLDGIDTDTLPKLKPLTKWLNGLGRRKKKKKNAVLANTLICVLEDKIWAPQLRQIKNGLLVELDVPSYKVKCAIVDAAIERRGLAVSRVAYQQIVGSTGTNLHTLIRRLSMLSTGAFEITASSEEASVVFAMRGTVIKDMSISTMPKFTAVSEIMRNDKMCRNATISFVDMVCHKFGAASIIDAVSASIDGNVRHVSECSDLHDLIGDMDLLRYAGGAMRHHDEAMSTSIGDFNSALLRLGCDVLAPTMVHKPYVAKVPTVVEKTLEYQQTRHLQQYYRFDDRRLVTQDENIDRIALLRKLEEPFSPYNPPTAHQFFTCRAATTLANGLARRYVLNFDDVDQQQKSIKKRKGAPKKTGRRPQMKKQKNQRKQTTLDMFMSFGYGENIN